MKCGIGAALAAGLLLCAPQGALAQQKVKSAVATTSYKVTNRSGLHTYYEDAKSRTFSEGDPLLRSSSSARPSFNAWATVDPALKKSYIGPALETKAESIYDPGPGEAFVVTSIATLEYSILLYNEFGPFLPLRLDAYLEAMVDDFGEISTDGLSWASSGIQVEYFDALGTRQTFRRVACESLRPSDCAADTQTSWEVDAYEIGNIISGQQITVRLASIAQSNLMDNVQVIHDHVLSRAFVDPLFYVDPVWLAENPTARLIVSPGISNDVAVAPESATWALMLVGFGLAGAGLRRRRVALS